MQPRCARSAASALATPSLGCVIVRGGEIVGRGRNRREEKRSALSHAETEAIREANAALGSWRLEEHSLVTKEGSSMKRISPIRNRGTESPALLELKTSLQETQTALSHAYGPLRPVLPGPGK